MGKGQGKREGGEEGRAAGRGEELRRRERVRMEERPFTCIRCRG